MTIELSDQEFYLLIYALGISTGYACKDGDNLQFRNQLLQLANTINNNNPNWTFCEVKEVKS